MESTCIYCGEPLAPKAKFCPKCGRRVEKLKPEPVGPAPSEPVQHENTEPVPVRPESVDPEPVHPDDVDPDATVRVRHASAENVTSPQPTPRQADKKQPKRSPKKAVIIAAAAVIVCAAAAFILVPKLSSAPEPTPPEVTAEVSAQPSELPDTQPDNTADADYPIALTGAEAQTAVDAVLDREVFYFKLIYSDIYGTSGEVTNSEPYEQNWDIRQLLCEPYFTGIEWSAQQISDSEIYVTFSGTAAGDDSDVELIFSLTPSNEGDFIVETHTLNVTDGGRLESISKTDFNAAEFPTPWMNAEGGIAVRLLELAGLQADAGDAADTGSYDPEAYRSLLAGLDDVYYYCLYDIEGDGVPELFVKTGTCEADFVFNLYALRKGTPTLIDELPGGHTYLCGLGEKGTFLLQFGHMEYEKITKYTLSDNKLSETVLFDSQVPFQGYHELSSPKAYAPDDLSGLNWTANEPEDNQSVMDSYSLDSAG